MDRPIRPRAEYEDELRRIGARLREARKAAGLSQISLAELSDIPQGSISEIETGQLDVRIATLLRLTNALGITVGSVTDGE